MEDWTLIYTSNKIQEVYYIKELLEDKGIVSVIVNKQDSIYLFGEIELYVPREEAFSATQIINNLESE